MPLEASGFDVAKHLNLARFRLVRSSGILLSLAFLPISAKLLIGFNSPFVQNIPNPTGSEWQTSDVEEIRLFQADPFCGKPFSNSMTYSVLKGFHDLCLPEPEAPLGVSLN